jgi:hypothetical protein
MNGCNRASYINEFLWRQWNDVDRVEAYDKILEEIGKYYPPEELKLIDLDNDEEENDEMSFSEWSEQDEKDGTWSEIQREASEREDSKEEESEREDSKEEESEGEDSKEEESEREDSKEEESEGEINETEERILKKKIKSMIIKNEDSDNVTKSKIFQIIDFFDTYQFTFKFKKLKKKHRRLIHVTLDNNSCEIYHFTRRGELFVSNDESYKQLHTKYSKLKCIEKSEKEKVDILNEKLKSLNLTAVTQNSLILEKSSFNSTIYISKETAEIVNEVLSEKKQLIR